MRTYASAAYISTILFITQIEHQLHARKVDVQVWTSDARMLKGDARMLRDDEDSPYTEEIPGVPCEGRPTDGPCDMRIGGITFDPVSKTCKSYDSSGCSKTKNSFRDIEECEAKCRPRENHTIKAQEIDELKRQGICDIKPCCCDSCYPCDYERIAKARTIADAMKTSDEKPPLKIKLNINLNGISNGTDGIKIVDDSKENIVTDGDVTDTFMEIGGRSLKNVESKAPCWGGNYENCAKNCESVVPDIAGTMALRICKLGCLTVCP